MPVYEYSCKACEKQFELLVRKQTVVKCPSCQSDDLEKLFSLPAVQSSGTRALAMKAAKKRDAKQGNERVQAQTEYELNHD
jgi:putative FmdB family regulatory protein